MNTTFRTIFIVSGVIVVAALLLLGGFWMGRAGWGMTYTQTYGAGMMGSHAMMNQRMMSRGNMPALSGVAPNSVEGMGGDMMSNGMMGNPIMNGAGMSSMMGSGMGMMAGGMPGGMMNQNRMGNNSLSTYAEPLSLGVARETVAKFLAAENNPDLAIREIMIFNNHAYAEIVEISTGIGAMEVLVDPVTLAITPEHGPNMMWNLKYGTAATRGMGGISGSGGMMGMMMNGSGMMGSSGHPSVQSGDISAEMPISPEEALASAQRYLDTYQPDTQAGEDAHPFYGYYTFHILQDGQIVGMLSVNGDTGQVFPHPWHGEFVEMSGE